MEYGLSFFLDEDKVESAFNLLDSSAEIVAAIAKVGAKVDLLLDEASTSSTQLLRDAYTAFDAQGCNSTYISFMLESVPEHLPRHV